MEQIIQTPTKDEVGLEALEAQIRECFGRVVYTHKAHEKSADHRLQQAIMLKHLQITLSALATGTLIITIFGDPAVSKVSAIISAIITAGLFIVSTMTKDSDYGKMAEQHKTTAIKLWDIRERYLSLLADLHAGQVDMNELRETRDQLQKELGAVYSEAPRTTNRGYHQAQKGLKQEEELTFSDQEIDNFLPKPLRKIKSNP